MILVVVIAITIILVGLGKFIHKNQYPFAIFVIALSLLFFRSLISSYITGYDIHEEYYFANLTTIEGSWDPGIPHIVNSLLSITILAPTVSAISGIELTWIFKIFYPLVFAFSTVGLFHIFKKQTNDERIAFLACFFLLGLSRFYHDIALLPRQLVASLFLICLISLTIDKNMGMNKKNILTIAFGILLIVSHYGLAFVFILLLVFSKLLVFIYNKLKSTRIGSHRFTIQEHHSHITNSSITKSNCSTVLNLGFIIFFVCFALAWFTYVSGGKVIDAQAFAIDRVFSNMSTDFLHPSVGERVETSIDESFTISIIKGINEVLSFSIQLCLIFGLFLLARRSIKPPFEREFAVFAILCSPVFLLTVAPPFLVPISTALSLDIGRLYHIMLFFLSPFCIIGGVAFISLLVRKRHRKVSSDAANHLGRLSTIGYFSLFLALFFVFQTRLPWELTGSYSGSTSLGQAWIKENGDVQQKAALYSAVTPKQDITSAIWLQEHKEENSKIYATYDDAQVHPLTSYGMIYNPTIPVDLVIPLSPFTSKLNKGRYVYLQSLNVVDSTGSDIYPEQYYYDMSKVSHLLKKHNRIYTNTSSEIYR
ncbi:MAG: DUF2206 domain-containing protein [Chloroflexi bacterium]|nr:DUF2206 domain-containing protein [Chloroflexota bacterium]